MLYEEYNDCELLVCYTSTDQYCSILYSTAVYHMYLRCDVLLCAVLAMCYIALYYIISLHDMFYHWCTAICHTSIMYVVHVRSAHMYVCEHARARSCMLLAQRSVAGT